MGAKTAVIFMGMVFLADVYCAVFYHSTFTSQGIIVGKIEDVRFRDKLSKVVKFLGIPYARRQIGSLRFQKPLVRQPFNTPYNATFFRPACIHPVSGHLDIRTPLMHEDCLFLNIVAPADSTINPTRRYPVLIYLHGGDFKSGSSSDVSPEILAFMGDVVVVTVNYRVGVLGFLSTRNGHMLGNYGLWDQHHAIKWVRFNIAAFGGDKDRITLIGQDAGATSAILQAMYPGNFGLFQRVISMSGRDVNPWALTEPSAYRLGKKLNCFVEKTDDDEDEYDRNHGMVECMRDMPVADLLAASSSLTDVGPTIDGLFITDHPYNILFPVNDTESDALQFFRSLDVVIGINDQDGDRDLISVLSKELGLNDLEKYYMDTVEFEQLFLPNMLSPFFQHRTVIRNGSISNAIIENIRYSVMFQYTNWSDPENATHLRSNLLRLSTDLIYGRTAVQIADAHSDRNRNASTYFYEFAQNPSFSKESPPWVTGAGHGSETKFMFGFQPDMVGSSNPRLPWVEFKLAANMMKWISNFAKTGNPNKPFLLFDDDSEWAKYNQSRHFIKMEGNFSAHARFGEPFTSFWQTLIPVLLLNKEKCKPEVTKPVNGSDSIVYTALQIPSDSVNLVVIVLITVTLLLFILLLVVSICLVKFCLSYE